MPFADEYNAMNKLVEALKSFGLSEYEAKALLTLLSKGELTAKEISELSGIPRTSVYDVMSSLESKGLVKSFGKPLRFRALKTDEILSILSKKVSDNLELLKRELPKLETDEEIEEVKVYRGDAVFGILRMLVGSAKERIQVLLSHISKDIEDILRSAKCKLVVVSSDARRIEFAESYELPTKSKSVESPCYGLLIFDDKKVMIIFVNHVKIGIVSDGEGLVLFSRVLINSLIEFLKSADFK